MFHFKQLSLAKVHSLFLIAPYIEPYQLLPLWAIADLGAMAMWEYSTFPKAPTLLGTD